MRLDLPTEQPLGLEGRLVGAAVGELAFIADGTLSRAPLAGGGVREVAKDILSADWSKDGTRFAVVRRVGPKHVLEYPIGTILRETVGEIFGVRLSPDGARVAILEHPSPGVVDGWIGVVDQGGTKRLTRDPRLIPSSPIWSPHGTEIWFTARGSDWTIIGVSLAGRERLLLRTPHTPMLHAALDDGRGLLSLGDSRRQVAGSDPGRASSAPSVCAAGPRVGTSRQMEGATWSPIWSGAAHLPLSWAARTARRSSVWARECPTRCRLTAAGYSRGRSLPRASATRWHFFRPAPASRATCGAAA
jgi:hypothetical protein